MTNRGIGDTDAVLEPHRVGVLVDELSPTAYRAAWSSMEQLLEEGAVVRERCRRLARSQFDLGLGAARYRPLYEQVSA